MPLAKVDYRLSFLYRDRTRAAGESIASGMALPVSAVPDQGQTRMRLTSALPVVLLLSVLPFAAGAQQWRIHRSSDKMTGEMQVYAFSHNASPDPSLAFPFHYNYDGLVFGCNQIGRAACG